jgi:hypothetical protein
MLDMKPASGEVNITPLQAQQFTKAHTRVDGKHVQR